MVSLCCCLVSAHAQGKAKVLASSGLPLLLKMLETTPYGAHTGAASQGLYAVTLGDVDLQNEVAAQVRAACLSLCTCLLKMYSGAAVLVHVGCMLVRQRSWYTLDACWYKLDACW